MCPHYCQKGAKRCENSQNPTGEFHISVFWKRQVAQQNDSLCYSKMMPQYPKISIQKPKSVTLLRYEEDKWMKQAETCKNPTFNKVAFGRSFGET